MQTLGENHKITSGSYRPGFTHPDWEKALEAIPEAERDWLKVRIGQGITGPYAGRRDAGVPRIGGEREIPGDHRRSGAGTRRLGIDGESHAIPGIQGFGTLH